VPGAGLGRAALSDNRATMESFDVAQFSPEERALLEITLPSALELAQLRMGTLVDIRQGFEIEMKGAIPDAVHIPLFEVKRLLGDKLTEDEQEILDTGKPSDIDIKGLLTTINRLHHAHDHLLLLTCNSGRRSLYAAKLLRSLGYPKALSVAGGFLAWKKPQTAVKT
jgi:rhodanese-related sulfurtransferase